jgi:2-isopropylmalate synthase
MDRIVESLKTKKFVFWEEIARDGAQAKTILDAKQRIEIAQKHAGIFGQNGPDHLVFAAGFVSICKEEFKVIKELAERVDNCYIGVNCRSNIKEIDLSIEAVKSAKYPRIAYVLPFSERMCQLMLHKTPQESLNQGIDIARYALDKSNGIPIDVQLAGSFDADPVFVAEAAARLKEAGISITHLGDTRGRLYPREVSDYLKKMLENSAPDQLYGVHFHNDLGFALANNLESIRQGIQLAATSWLGLAERNGLVPTELLLFLLSYQKEKLNKRLGFEGNNLFSSAPDIKKLGEMAELVSHYTGVPLKITDPIVGTGVNTISTGTPFVDTNSFQPFDSEMVLGVPRKIYVTQLASTRLIKEVANLMGYTFDENQLNYLLDYVKKVPYQTGRAIFPESDLNDLFERVKNGNHS